MHNLASYEKEHIKQRDYEENIEGWKLTVDIEEDEEDFHGNFYYKGRPTPLAEISASTKGNSLLPKVKDNTTPISNDDLPEER